MKPTDYIYLYYNPTNSTGDLRFKLYPETKYNMGSSGGRWNNPTNNKANFMASSPVSSCCQFSTGNVEWSGQGDDITTLVERHEKHKKIFTDHNVQSTVSSPPNFWKNACSSHSCTFQQSLPFSSRFSSQCSRNGMPFVMSGVSGFSSNNQSSFGLRTSHTPQSSNDSFVNTNYENDCLMQMD